MNKRSRLKNPCVVSPNFVDCLHIMLTLGLRSMLFAVVLSSGEDRRLDRLRYFSDHVRPFVRSDGLPQISGDGLSRLLDDAIGYSTTDSDQVPIVFSTMTLLNCNSISDKQYDDVMWEAIRRLCSSASIPPTVLGSEIGALGSPASMGGHESSSHCDLTLLERRGGTHLEIETSITGISGAIGPSSEPEARQSGDQLPNSKKRIRAQSEEVNETKDFEAAIETEEAALRKKIDPYFSGSRSPMILTTSDGQKFLAHKFTSLARARSFGSLMSNFDLLKHVGVQASLLQYLFHDTRNVMMNPEYMGDQESVQDLQMKRILREKSEFLKRPLHEATFLAQLRSVCKDPRIARRISPRVSHSRNWTKTSEKLAQRASENNLAYVRSTIDFIELAGVDRYTIGDLLQKTCRILFPLLSPSESSV